MARIVIVDDNSLMRQCVTKLLGTHKEWEVCGEAADGEHAVQLAKDLAPDVMILDFLLPGINGLEAAREISKVSPRTSIVLCTIVLSPQLVDLARGVGIAGAIDKGELTHMVDGVEAVLQGNSFFR